MPWWRHHFIENAVRLDANAEFIFERLEVNVTGVVLDGQEENHVQQFADRCTVGKGFGTSQVDRTFTSQQFGLLFEVKISFEVLNDLLDTTFFPRAAQIWSMERTSSRVSFSPHFVFRASTCSTIVAPALARNSCDLVQLCQLLRW